MRGANIDYTQVNIKQAELMTNRCGADYVWARFKRANSKHCPYLSGFWDITFHDAADAESMTLRAHFDAILSALQHGHIQHHFDIYTGAQDRSLCDHEHADRKKSTLRILFGDDEKTEYKLKWYNGTPLKLTAQVICIQKEGDDDEMYIMYLPKHTVFGYQWQRYDGDASTWVDFDDERELLQLECSYLFNYHAGLCSEYECRRDLSVCAFEAFMKNVGVKRSKLYALRYSDSPDGIISEQVRFESGTDFSWSLRRIQVEQAVNAPWARNLISMAPVGLEFTDESSAYNEQFIARCERLVGIMLAYHRWLRLLNADKRTKDGGILAILAKTYDVEQEQNKALIELRNDFGDLIHEMKTNERLSYDVEIRKISAEINTDLAKEKHNSNKCICVERTHRGRADDDVENQYFGFSEVNEIVAQQLLDTYHCVLVHLCDDGDVIESEMFGSQVTQLGKSSLTSRHNTVKGKFTDSSYQAGFRTFRFFYWKCMFRVHVRAMILHQ